MAKVLTTTDKLKKLLSVIITIFPKDVYILGGLYCFEGPESKELNGGTHFCVLSMEQTQIINEYFHSNGLIFLNDIRKLRTDLGKESEQEYYIMCEDEMKILEIKGLRDEYLKKVQKVKQWKKFHLSENQVVAMINDNSRITLFSDDEEIPEIYITKSLLPAITLKKMDNLYYQVTKNKQVKDGYELIVNFNEEEFQLYMIYTYLNYKQKGEA